MSNDPNTPPRKTISIADLTDEQCDWLLKELGLPSLAERREMNRRRREENEMKRQIDQLVKELLAADPVLDNELLGEEYDPS